MAEAAGRNALRLDIALYLLVAAVGGAIGIWLVFETHALFFYQTMMPSGVMAACGHGLSEPATIPPALWDFLALKTSTVDCGVLDGVQGTGTLSAMARSHFYLLSAAAALWSVGGLSYTALWPLVAALHGAYSAAGYALGRLFLSRRNATVLALLLAFSPLAMAVLAWSLRDYAKAPFLLWSLVLMILALRAGSGRRLTVLGAALGAVVGLGAGFRGDVVEIFPLAIFALTLGQWRGPVPVPARLGAAGAFLAAAALLMAPLKIGVDGGAGAVWMQGATEPYRWELHLPPAPYDLGERYSDELTYSAIAADLRRPDPAAYDAGEALPGTQSQAQRLSTRYVSGWADLFAADTATRALASIWWNAGFPALLILPRPPVVLYDAAYPGSFSLAQRLAPVMAILARPWMPALGVLGLLSILWRAYARSRREAAGLAILLVTLLAIPSMQFATRHIVHLEGLFWLGLLSLLSLPWSRAAPRGTLPGFAAWFAGCMAVTGALYLALGIWQDETLHRAVDALLDAPAERLPLDAAAIGGGRTLVRVTAQPPDAAGLFGGPRDAATLHDGPRYFDSIRAAAVRLIVEIAPGCRTGNLSLTLAYDKMPDSWQAFDRVLSVPVPPAGSEPALVVVPVFYRSDQAFRGFEVADTDLPCLQAIKQAQKGGRLPIIFSAVLEPGWEQRPLHLSLGGDRGPPPPR